MAARNLASQFNAGKGRFASLSGRARDLFNSINGCAVLAKVAPHADGQRLLSGRSGGLGNRRWGGGGC